MNAVFYPFLILMFAMASCATSDETRFSSLEIASRDGIATYICDPPGHWQLTLPDEGVDLNESTLPLVSWKVDDELLIVVHNFPGQPIPPRAQVARWEKQVKNPDESATSLEQVAWGGFEGLKLYICDHDDKAVMAWAMTLPIFHRYALQGMAREAHLAADWTIKITGSAAAMRENMNEIDRFIHSFRLKREIPNT